MINKENNFVKDINVPSKEQIIVDGVNITSCCHRKNNLCSCPHYKKECARNPNCHFKIVERQRKKIDKFYRKELELCQQLARKTQECEELKTEKEVIKKYLGISDKSIMQRLEELTEYKLKRQLEYIKIGEKRDRYRKALEEIEAATKINCEEICGRKFENCNDTSCFSVNILDIINKAKGEEDEHN